MAKNQRSTWAVTRNQLSGTISDASAISSKSLSNRILPLTFLSSGSVKISNLLVSEDTEIMSSSPVRTRVNRSISPQTFLSLNWKVSLEGGFEEFYVGNSGTSVRFLSPFFCFRGGAYLLYGTNRMNSRPIDNLLANLRILGSNLRGLVRWDSLPIIVGPPHVLSIFSTIQLRGNVSSQFATAMLFGGQCRAIQLLTDVPICSSDTPVSGTYISMTLRLLERFGIIIERWGWERYSPSGKSTQATSQLTLKIETDLSSVSYFLASSLVSLSRLRIPGIPVTNLQGDSLLIGILDKMGLGFQVSHSSLNSWSNRSQLGPARLDCNSIPDAAMSLVVLSVFVDTQSNQFNQLLTWRFKETDRMLAMAMELRKFQLTVEGGTDFIRTEKSRIINHQNRTVWISTYQDHRMAMSIAILSFAGWKIRIRRADCVNKTFPDFFYAFNNLSSNLKE